MAAINRTLTILQDGTDSEIVEALELAPRVSILIMSPAGLVEATKVQVAPNPSGTFIDLQTDGVDVTLVAGKATQITILGGACWKLKAATVAADRVFRVIANRIGEPYLP